MEGKFKYQILKLSWYLSVRFVVFWDFI